MLKRYLLIPFFVIMALWAFGAEAYAAVRSGEENALCLGCHGSRDMSLSFSNGEKMQLFVDSRSLAGSVHKGLNCSSCHGFSVDNHPHPQFKGRRGFRVSSSGMCRKCHNFKKGIHYKMLGVLKETVCVDCHGSHDVKPVSDNADACYGCHRHGISMTYRDGSTSSLTLETDILKSSVHNKLRCADCHFGFSAKEHPERTFMSARDFTIVSTEICRRCHFDKYTKTLEGIHFNMMSKGNLSAPVCVDCHGSHRIDSGRKEKIRSAQRCAKCHEGIYRTYAMSVHGKSLLSEHNQDVPVCSDCHMAHDISDPRLVNFRNNIPQMCGNCHANKDLMKKYGLSTAVLQSYLEDFHGVTLTFYKKQEGPVRHIAVCIDCHGIHDITRVKGPNATVLKANLVKRCQKCHAGATENFPASWISHYEPDFKRAPLVYAINLIYSIFIPFMIVGLVLQIILHIWRYAVNR